MIKIFKTNLCSYNNPQQMDKGCEKKDEELLLKVMSV